MSRVATAAAEASRIERMPMSANDSAASVTAALPIFLRHGSPRLLLGAVLCAVGVRLWLGEWSALDLLPPLVLLVVWPVQEWLIHVFLLHFKPIRVAGRTIDFPTPRKHRQHHRDPWNYDLLFIPLHTYLYSLPLLWLLWHGSAPSLPVAFTGIAFHLSLALHYEWIHFLIHTRVQPKTKFYQHLWRGHRLHHFKSERHWYGVTRTEGDWLFGTAPGVKHVPTSATCRELLGGGAAPAAD